MTIFPVIKGADSSKDKVGAQCLHLMAVSSFASVRTKRNVLVIESDSGKIFISVVRFSRLLLHFLDIFCNAFKIFKCGAGGVWRRPVGRIV